MQFPLEQAYLDERAAFVRTIESLTDDEFDHAPTLCEGWAPRDVLAHLLGIDSSLLTYARSFGVSRGNEAIVAAARRRSREDLLAEARRWATAPALTTRPLAWFYLGDLGVHHQDVLRGLGRNRVLPLPVRDAILREGSTLGAPKLLTHRIEPRDGGRARGRGSVVHGTSEALGLWLCGRRSVADELEFMP